MAEAALNAQDAFPSITCNGDGRGASVLYLADSEVVHKMGDEGSSVSLPR